MSSHAQSGSVTGVEADSSALNSNSDAPANLGVVASAKETLDGNIGEVCDMLCPVCQPHIPLRYSPYVNAYQSKLFTSYLVGREVLKYHSAYNVGASDTDLRSA